MNIKIRSMNGSVHVFENVYEWTVTDVGINLVVSVNGERKKTWVNKAMVSSVEEE